MLCSFTFIKNRFNQCVIIFMIWWFYRVYILHIWKKQAFVCVQFVYFDTPTLASEWRVMFLKKKKVTFLECFSQYKNFTPPKHHHIAPKITNPWCMSNNAVPRTHTSLYTGILVYTCTHSFFIHRTGINVSSLKTSLARIKTWTCCGPES